MREVRAGEAATETAMEGAVRFRGCLLWGLGSFVGQLVVRGVSGPVCTRRGLSTRHAGDADGDTGAGTRDETGSERFMRVLLIGCCMAVIICPSPKRHVSVV
jgi:hypothetical protein